MIPTSKKDDGCNMWPSFSTSNRSMISQGAMQTILPILDAGPWVSSGRRLNYEQWSARERFVKLDELIEKQKHEYYEQFAGRVLDLYTHGVEPDSIAERLCMKRDAVFELLADINCFTQPLMSHTS